MLTIPLRFSIKKLNEVLDKHAPFKNIINPRGKTQKNLGSLLEYLIQLQIKLGCIERS